MPQDDRESCPITDIEIVKKDDRRQELNDWSSVDINYELTLYYTKNADALPVTEFGLDIG